ncbi:hypothetical protein [Asanoa hainanensis]|uniref:hypothetical protein n=1 Tax=Asanoa hainanensis TaxID=560556 RepID=UPI003CCBE127
MFGGWELHARIGRITREHGDVEFWVERIHAERSETLLLEADATPLTTQPPEESLAAEPVLAQDALAPDDRIRDRRGWQSVRARPSPGVACLYRRRQAIPGRRRASAGPNRRIA